VWSPNCDDRDFAGTYNAQLGTGWVHSESGRNYLRDPDTQKWENGPDGPGYYVHHDNGNQEKLQPGWVDPD
jgi:glucan-binding YG repeat protein